jgi:hypothetical protein
MEWVIGLLVLLAFITVLLIAIFILLYSWSEEVIDRQDAMLHLVKMLLDKNGREPPDKPEDHHRKMESQL